MTKISTDLQINGLYILEPSQETINIGTIVTDDSGRDCTNEMTLTIIDNDQQSVSLGWYGLNYSQAAVILTAVKAPFTLRYINPLTGTHTTRTFYCTNRTCTVKNKVKQIYESIAFECIDMRKASER